MHLAIVKESQCLALLVANNRCVTEYPLSKETPLLGTNYNWIIEVQSPEAGLQEGSTVLVISKSWSPYLPQEVLYLRIADSGVHIFMLNCKHQSDHCNMILRYHTDQGFKYYQSKNYGNPGLLC